MTKDDPDTIADYLIQEHGLNEATRIAVENSASATDNYELSVWREVKTILQERNQ